MFGFRWVVSLFEGSNKMPIYEYACDECGHRMEKLQKMSDAPLTDCPECGKSSLTKLVSAGGFILNGDGWYKGSSSDSASEAAPSCATGGCCACD